MKDNSSSKDPLQKTPAESPAFALISTLLIIAVLTIMVVAFMQSMRVDRLTARSYLDKYRADLAAQSGLEKAVVQIQAAINDPVTGKGDFTYTTELMEDNNSVAYSPVIMFARYSTNAAGKLAIKTLYPIVSTTNTNIASFSYTNATYVSSTTFTAASNIVAIRKKIFDERRVLTNAIDLNWGQYIQATNTYGPSTDPANYYRMAFQYLTNSVGGTNQRFAYVVLDDQSKLNPQYNRAKARDNGETPAEIPLSLGDTTLLTTAEQTAYLVPTVPPSTSPLRFVDTNRVNNIRQFFGSYDVPNQDVIPAGYVDAGKPKYNINDLATNTVYGATATERAENIGSIIDANLPLFKDRDLSLASQSVAIKKRYLNRLAASIVDYIDTDTEITTVNGGEPAGRDLFPLVTAVAEQFRWTSQSYNAGTREYTATIQTRGYAQIWNPYSTNVVGNVKLMLKNRMKVKYGNNLSASFSDYDPANVSVTVKPNEFKVVEFATTSQNFVGPLLPADPVTPAPTPGWGDSPTEAQDTTSHPYFQLYWNDKLVDMNSRAPLIQPGTRQAGMPRGNKNLVLNTITYQLGFIPTYASSPNWRFVGDPRATYLTTYDWASMGDASYPGSSRWGGIQDTTQPRYQDFKANWVNRDPFRVNPILGATPGSLSTTPAQVTSPYIANEATQKLNAPFYIRNDKMLSIAELGNIFDPVQADDQGQAPPGGSPPVPYVAAGGRTLRIGQPEFSYWDVPGKRASQLLDLFTTVAPVSSGAYPEVKGRVNINTAPSEVLQALLYNIQIKGDQGYYGNNPSLISTMTQAKAKILADAIVKDRSTNGGYIRISELYRLYGLVDSASVPYWNKASAYAPNLGTGGTNAPPDVMDRSREELFTKMVNLVDVQSRSFTVFSAGQSLGPTGKVLARSNLQAQIAIVQGTDSAGRVVLIPKIVNEKFY